VGAKVGAVHSVVMGLLVGVLSDRGLALGEPVTVTVTCLVSLPSPFQCRVLALVLVGETGVARHVLTSNSWVRASPRALSNLRLPQITR